MKKMINYYRGLLCFLGFSFISYQGYSQDVYVTIPPLKYFTQKIMGEGASVGVVLAPGQNPHSYTPSAKQVASLSKAKLLVTVGVPFEKMLVGRLKKNAPKLQIVDSTKGIKKREFKDHEGHDHHDHHEDEHDDHKKHGKHDDHEDGHEGHHDEHEGHDEHEEWDPHVWMAPKLAMKQGENILKALIAWQPERKSEFEKNYAKLQKELESVHEVLERELKPLKGSSLFVYHPAYGYLADGYGLKQFAIEVKGKQPTADDLKKLIHLAKKEKARVIFVQKQFPVSSAKAVSEGIGGVVMSLDPLAENYVENMKGMGKTISEALKKD